MRKRCILCMVILWVSLVAAQDWPQYLGPDRTGMSTETGFPIDWIKDPPKVLWKQPLGEGFGGAAIVGGKVYVLDRVDAKEDVFRCFDMKNGKELWHYSHPDTGEFSFNGSRAVPTIEGDRAYAVGAMGTVYCMDLKTQKPVWTHNFMKDFNAELPTWAYSQSPLIVRDLVIVAPQGREAGVVAYNKLTGELMWKTGRLSNDPGYSSPVLATLSGVEQIVQVTPYLSPELRESEEDEEEDENPEPYFEKGGVYGIDITTGSILWNYKPFDCVITIPPVTIVGDGRILITGEYDASTTMIKVEKKKDKFVVTELYKKEDVKSQIHQAILFKDHFYLISNGNSTREGLTCMRLDGKVLWKTGRRPNFERGGLLLADGKLFIVEGKKGELYCVNATPEKYEELGKIPLLKKNQVWGPLALSNGYLVVRDQEQIICVKLK